MTSAIPSAGRIVPKTSPAGICTTPIVRPVSTRTLTSTLKPRPKKALVSPLTHQGRGVADSGGAVVVAMAASSGRRGGFGRHGGGERGQCGEKGAGRRRPAEDAALGGDHLEADPLELR